MRDSTCNSVVLGRSGLGSVSLPGSEPVLLSWASLSPTFTGKTGPNRGLKPGVVCAQLGEMMHSGSSLTALYVFEGLCARG